MPARHKKRPESIIAVPQDGGWGWVIAIVSFYSFMIIDVPSIGFQVILQDLMDVLGIAASTASVIFSSYTLTFQFLGPLAAGICNRYGFRATTIAGCFLVIFGFLVSHFLRNYACYVIFFGIISGVGSSLVYMVATVAPGFWFEEKRAIVFGLVSASSGFAVFTVNITSYVRNNYGWRMCFMFWIACFGLLCVLALMLKMPPLVELIRTRSDWAVGLEGRVSAMDNMTSIQSVRPIRKKSYNEEELGDEKLQRLADSFGVSVRGSLSAPSLRKQESSETEIDTKCAKCLRFLLCKANDEIGARPLYREDIFYQGSISHAIEVEHLDKKTYALKVYHLPTGEDVLEEFVCKWKIPEAVWRVVKEMVDFSLFKSPVFLFLVVASLLVSIAIYIPVLLIKKVNVGHMDESTASLLTTVMGIGTTTGRSFIGFLLFYFPKLKAMEVLIVAMVLGGISVCLVPLSYSVAYQMVISFLAGALPAVFTPLRSVVIIDMLGLKVLTEATGILCFMQGIGCFIGMPTAELLNELSGTNYLGLVFSGICYILTGITFLCLALLAMINKKRFHLDQDLHHAETLPDANEAMADDIESLSDEYEPPTDVTEHSTDAGEAHSEARELPRDSNEPPKDSQSKYQRGISNLMKD